MKHTHQPKVCHSFCIVLRLRQLMTQNVTKRPIHYFQTLKQKEQRLIILKFEYIYIYIYIYIWGLA